MEATQAVAARYVLDVGMSRLQVRAFATGLLSGFGHNPTFAVRDFKGEMRIPPSGLEDASIQLRIAKGSLEVTGDIKDKDRRDIERVMKDDVLETERYPEIVFESSSVSADKTGETQYRVRLNGELSLHGVTRSQEVNGYLTMGEDQLKAYGNFSLLQTDYGIRLVSFAGGALKVKDELKFTFDLLARRVKE
jgi:polyisoprenoid-binding protein YceI